MGRGAVVGGAVGGRGRYWLVGGVMLPTIGLVALVGLCADTLVLVREAGEAAEQAALPAVPPQ